MDIQPSKNNSSYSFNGNLTPSVPGGDPLAALVVQVEQEYKEAKAVLDVKIATWQKRLKVYSNQRKDADAIGDTLLFTTMQTVLASIYEDDLLAVWEGQNSGDEELEEALDNTARFDYRKMHKDVLDYFWMWDTLFFGHSVLYMTDFDIKKKISVPDLQNPMLFYRDPLSVMMNGYPWNGRNASRFFGRWIELSKPQMQKNSEYYNLDRIRPDRAKSEDIDRTRQAYSDAQGLTYQNNQVSGDNQLCPLLEWCTHWQGKKVLVTLANERKTVVRYHEFTTRESAGSLKPAEKWPVVDRMMYPMSHDWDCTSVPDIIEDKQRMRAVLKNMAVKNLKADLYPTYVFDKQRIENEVNLGFGFNKFIGVKSLNGQNVANALSPIQKSQFNVAVHQYILESMAQDAEKATATPQMQQGNLNDQRRLATELNMVDRNVGTRYSLTAKVFGWSEADFWREWYRQLKDNFAHGIHEKVVRINSPYGARFKAFTRENLIATEDPDVHTISKYVRDNKRSKERQEFVQYFSLMAQIPGSNIRYGMKKLGKLLSIDKDELDRLLPKTVDERIAEAENLQLEKNKPVLVNANDDHLTHLEIHAKASDTPSAYAHKAAHERALMWFRENPALLPGYGEQQAKQQQDQATMSQNMPRLMGGSGGGGGSPSTTTPGQAQPTQQAA